MSNFTKEQIETARQELPMALGRESIAAVNALCDLALEALAMREALTPSDDTKAAYIGEFSVPLPERDKDGNEAMRQVNVPWTTIKQIMAAIKAHAIPKVKP